MIGNSTSRTLRIALALGALAAAAWPTLAAEKTSPAAAPAALHLNELEYLEMPGLNVMLAHDYYPEGHQGGVGIIQNGVRVATNGDIRLDRTPGQWQPVPKVGKRVVDKATGEISLRAEYPDESKNRKGFNPVDYPDLRFAYTVRVRPEGKAFRILVDLEQPLPDEWVGRVGLQPGAVPRDPLREVLRDRDAVRHLPAPGQRPGRARREGGVPDRTARHRKAPRHRPRVRPPEDEHRGREGRRRSSSWTAGASTTTGGSSCARSSPRARRQGAVEWLVTPHAIPGFTAAPTVQVSQVGYHPKQQKWAIVETDPRDTRRLPVVVSRITGTGALEKAIEARPQAWGRFLRYDYLRLDFTSVEKPGMYVVSYGDARSNPFRIGEDVYQRHVWQPTVESFLPIQMCHVRVNERYRVWHDACHLDDARMAPVSHNHFDGYLQGPSTLTKFAPGRAGARARPRRVARRGRRRPARRVAGGHDARPRAGLGGVPSRPRRHRDRPEAPRRRDAPARRQARRAAADRARRPDGGGRLPGPRPLLPRHHQPHPPPVHAPRRLRGADRQRRVRPEDGASRGDPRRDRRPGLARRPVGVHRAEPAPGARAPPPVSPPPPAPCAATTTPSPPSASGIAKAIWDTTRRERRAARRPGRRTGPARGSASRWSCWSRPATGATPSTSSAQRDAIVKSIKSTGWVVGRALPLVGDAAFTSAVTEAVKGHRAEVLALEKKTPYGVPYEPEHLGRGVGDPGLRHGAVLPAHGLPGHLPEGRDAPRARTSSSASTRVRTTPRSSRGSARSRSSSATASTAPTGATSPAAASRAPPSSGRTTRSCSSGRTSGSRRSTSSAAARPTTSSWCWPRRSRSRPPGPSPAARRRPVAPARARWRGPCGGARA